MRIEQDFPDHTDKIDPKLIRRIKFLGIILFIMTGVLMYEIFVSNIDFIFILIGVSLGVLIGLIVGRMFSIRWDKEKNKVIGRLDTIGIIVLVIYICLSVSRHWIFAHWFVGTILTAFTVSFIEGVMFGRIFSLRFNIKKVLEKETDNSTKR